MLQKIIENPQATLFLFILGCVTLHAIYSYFTGQGESLYKRYKTRWLPLESITVTIAIYFWSQVVAALPLVVLLGDKVTGQVSVPIRFITVLAIDIVALGMVYLFLKRRLAKLQDIGLKRPELRRDAGYVLVGYSVYMAVYLILVKILQNFQGFKVSEKQEIGFETGITGLSLIFVFVSLVILPAIHEEIIMRGFLYTGLRSKLRMLQAGLLTSSIFAVAHLQAGSGKALLWAAALDTFVLSMVLVYLREKTGSLVAPIGLHMLKNGIVFILLFVMKVKPV